MTVHEDETREQRPPAEEPRPAGDGATAAGDAPRLAEGIELLGEYEDSGFREPHYVARRDDGQIIQLSRLLHVIAEQADGRRGYDEIAERTSAELDRGVSGDNVRYLVEQKLRPLGVLASADGTSQKLEKPDPLLALKFRARVLPASVSRALTTLFLPLFFPPVIVVVLAAIAAVDVWFFGIHGAAQPARELLYRPALLFMVLGLVVLATALHEIGHATALRYGGGEPGVMGAGIYLIWPAFYTDVTDAYRLGRGGRLRTDLGGIYFNGLFVLLVAGAYAVTRFEPLLVLVIVQHMQVVQQLLPFLRLDGYYVLSDLTGVPDLFSRIKPTLRSAVPGRETEAKVDELKPWVRWTVTAWVLALVPVLLLVFGSMVFNAPRLVATAWDSLGVQADKFQAGGTGAKAGAGLQMAALVAPLVGMTYSFARVGSRMVTGAWSWSEGSPLRRGLVATVTAGATVGAAWVLLPNGDYRPIQPGERGTLAGAVSQFRAARTGRPGLTEQRREELGGAPTERDRRPGSAPAGSEPPAPPPSPQPDGTGTVSGTDTSGTGDGGTATAPTDTTATSPTDTTTVPAETTTDTTATTTTTP